MKHVQLISRSPQKASIDLNALFNSKVESKENLITEKSQLFL